MTTHNRAAPPAFISGLTETGSAESGRLALSAKFDAAQFSPSLFNDYKLHCPEAIRRAATKRQAEYFAGRWLAAAALGDFGHHNFRLLADDKRCPLWPQDMVGSISHSKAQLSCVVAKRSHYRALGIDLQAPLSPAAATKLQQRILDPNERALVAEQDLPHWQLISLCFSAKESIYKALYPIVQRYFGFASAQLYSIDPAKQQLRFTIAPELASLPACPGAVSLDYQLSDTMIYSELALGAQLT